MDLDRANAVIDRQGREVGRHRRRRPPLQHVGRKHRLPRPGARGQGLERRLRGPRGQLRSQRSLQVRTKSVRHGDGAPGGCDGQQSVGVDGLERHVQPPRGRGLHPREKKGRIPVGHHEAGVAGQPREQARSRSRRGLDVGVIRRGPFPQLRRVLLHSLEHEGMQPIAGVGVVAAERLQDDQRTAQRHGVRHRMFQREIEMQASGRCHPVENKGAIRADGGVVEAVETGGIQGSILPPRPPVDGAPGFH